LFPNKASNYQLGGQFAAGPASLSIGHARKDWPRPAPEWFAQTLLP
jgi:hypothetical protein